MKRRVMLTVNVEAQPTLASVSHVDRLIYGRFDGESDFGIGRIFDVAERYGIRLTCFLDYAEQFLYGDALLGVGRYIASRNQDLQIHLRPEFIPRAIFDAAGVKYGVDMFKVEQAQADFLIDIAVDAHMRVTTTSPVAFRGGGYRYGKEILNKLAERKFLFNSGYNPARKNQPFNVGSRKQFQWDGGVVELPISCVQNFKNTGRLFDYNFNADVLMSGAVDECVEKHEKFLQEYFDCHGGDAIAVMTMHSWSFLNASKQGYYDAPNQDCVEKFDALLKMLSERYSVIAAGDLAVMNVQMLTDSVESYGKNNEIEVENMSEEKYVTYNYALRDCPVCHDSLAEFEIGGNCKKCGSRTRLRSLSPFVEQYINKEIPMLSQSDQPLLAFAMTGAEQKELSQIFKKFKSVSLFGKYAAGHEIGVDMRDLSRYEPNSFSGVFGCLLFDYFIEHELALRECFRVIAPGGLFFTHIAPYRIVDGDVSPYLKGAIKSRSGYFDYLPNNTELPDVKVGRDWFVSAMRRVGFQPAIVRVEDAIPGMVSEWFIGIKPGSIDSGSKVDLINQVKNEKLESTISKVFHSIMTREVDECLVKHEAFFQEYFDFYGNNAIPRMIMHSWSFLNVSETGQYDVPNQDYIDKFDALLAVLSKKYPVIAIDTLASMNVQALTGSVALDCKNDETGIGKKNEEKYVTYNYLLQNCPICHASVVDFDSRENCKQCGSPARLRSLPALVEQYINKEMLALSRLHQPLLAFSMDGDERKTLFQTFKKFKSVTLYGNYSTDCEVGVDIRDLSRYESNSFSGVFGCAIFDYFIEHEIALKECFRVTVPGGLFFTHIAPYRIVDGDVPPYLKGKIKRRAGYFEYLPDNTELPDIKVGRDWFVSTMLRAGFQPAIVRVKDAMSEMVLEWFVGIKPGTIDSEASVVPMDWIKGEKLESKISEVFHSIIPFGEKGHAALKIELIRGVSCSLVFLEDHLISAVADDLRQSREIVAANGSGNSVYISRNLGVSWVKKYDSVKWDSKIRAAFSLRDGGRLIRTFSGCMYHFDERDVLVNSQNTGKWHWHGSQGIGESLTGTVMYGEYAPLQTEHGVLQLSVWRYRSDSEIGWERVLTLPAAARPPAGELRHFHVCRPNPLNAQQWVLASGDLGVHNRLWLSDDDGDSWREIKQSESDTSSFPRENLPQILRFTQFSVMSNGDLIWATDDTKEANRAALIQFSMAAEKPTFHFRGWLGRNCVRNISSCGNDLFLMISESKNDTSSSDCILYDASWNRMVSLLLPNIGQVKSSVTDSLGSAVLTNNVGFYPALGAVLMNPDQRGIFRISIKEAV